MYNTSSAQSSPLSARDGVESWKGAAGGGEGAAAAAAAAAVALAEIQQKIADIEKKLANVSVKDLFYMRAVSHTYSSMSGGGQGERQRGREEEGGDLVGE